MNTHASSLSAADGSAAQATGTSVHSPRAKKQSTRELLLEAAGRVFAERGFAEATSKEICQLAGTNVAAVNYYFGGKEKLYEEVLQEAHRQLSDIDELDKILASDLAPEGKLRAFLRYMLISAMASSNFWGLKVLMREVISPTPNATEALIAAVLPKNLRMRTLIHHVTGMPVDCKEVQWAAGFIASQCIMVMLVPKNVRNTLFFTDDPEEQKNCFDALCTYILNGLHALQASWQAGQQEAGQGASLGKAACS